MYATKLMMNQAKIYNYVEDDSLLRKVENDVYGGEITIPNVRSAVNSFTYCGTLPTAIDGAVSIRTTMMTVFPNSITIYIASNGTLIVRNGATGVAILSTEPTDYVFPTITDTAVQPYVAFTLTFPTTSSQYMSFQYENGVKAVFEGSWANANSLQTNYNDVKTRVGDGTKLIDLALVYNRVLTDEEITQNFNAFVQRHRQEV